MATKRTYKRTYRRNYSATIPESRIGEALQGFSDGLRDATLGASVSNPGANSVSGTRLLQAFTGIGAAAESNTVSYSVRFGRALASGIVAAAALPELRPVVEEIRDNISEIISRTGAASAMGGDVVDTSTDLVDWIME